MSTLFVGQNKITLHSVDSTNNYAANLIKTSFVPEGTVIMAQNQNYGRGQRENKWISEPGKNLLCSYIFSPIDLNASSSFYLSMISALAAKETIEHFCSDSRVQVKWPNDIMLNDKKVGGILIENSIVKKDIKFSVIGIGLNINQTEFNYSNATSVCLVSRSVRDLDKVLNTLNEKLEKWYLQRLQKGMDKIVYEYNECLWKRFESISAQLHEGNRSVKIQEVKPDGDLIYLSGNQILQSRHGQIKLNYE